MSLLALTVARPWKTHSSSVAVLARKTEGVRCTMLLDEIDRLFKGPAEFTSALKGILYSGYERSGIYSRCVGDSWFDLIGYEGREGYSEESEQEYRRLRKQGNFVVVAAGKGLMIDELFLFEQAADAEGFYENGYRDREWWIEQEESYALC